MFCEQEGPTLSREEEAELRAFDHAIFDWNMAKCADCGHVRLDHRNKPCGSIYVPCGCRTYRQEGE